MVRTVLDDRHDLLLLIAGAGMAIMLGLLVVRAPVLALIGVGGLAVMAAAVRFGALAFAGAALALLPWLVVMEGVAPAQIATLIAAGATGALLWCALPLGFERPLVPIAAAGFLALVMINLALANEGEQYTQAAKYIVFASLAVAVSTNAARELLPTMKTPLLISSGAAMAFHLLAIAAGLGGGGSDSYYDAGEQLGLAADGPHALALLATIVAAAGLTVRRTWMQIALFGLGVVPALLTGVRSALVAIVVVLAIYLVQSGMRMRTVVVFVSIIAIAVVSGALDVVTARFASESGEFSSFESAGSGRGLIWTVAIEGWQASGPFAWVFGAGLKSVVEFEIAALASGFVGHSDVVEVLVQLGVLGFAAWALLWFGLLRSGLSAIVLLPILMFGIVNGTLEYVAALTVGLCLAAACEGPREPDAA